MQKNARYKTEIAEWLRRRKSAPVVALALGGGGARGLSHIGVLKAFESAGIKIDLIVGTSIGALVGAIYAFHPDSAFVHRKFAEFLKSQCYLRSNLNRIARRKNSDSLLGQMAASMKERVAINLAQSRLALASDKKVIEVLEFFLAHQDIENAQIPLAAVATDLNSGEEILFTEGDVIQAVAASSAIPGFFPPVKVADKLLVDGVLLNPVPILPARQLGADIVIAVDVGQDLDRYDEIENIIDIILRSNLVTAKKFNALLLEQADIILKPAVGRFHWADFKHLHELVQQGEQTAAARTIDILKRFIRKLFSLKN